MANNKKGILFISTINLTNNPRLLKEIKLALELNYNVYYIGFKIGNWSDKFDISTIENLSKFNYSYISATRRPFLPWFESTIIERIARLLYPLFKKNIIINALASNRRSCLIFKKNLHAYNISLICSHTLGALYPAYVFSKRLGVPFAFDFEDYYPGETIDKDSKNEKHRRETLMSLLCPKAAYISYASPLIGEYTLKLLQDKITPQNLLINNSFSSLEFDKALDKKKERIQLVWYSLNISFGRGLEMLIQAMQRFDDTFHLTLIGNLDELFEKDWILPNKRQITVLAPIMQEKINRLLSTFHVGLALELADTDLNRNLCLTNKLFSYVQSGLFVIATNTLAQEIFFKENPSTGILCNQNVEGLTEGLQYVKDNIDSITIKTNIRQEYFQKMSWENEKRKLILLWENIC